jgi:hypothetical protein
MMAIATRSSRSVNPVRLLISHSFPVSESVPQIRYDTTPRKLSPPFVRQPRQLRGHMTFFDNPVSLIIGLLSLELRSDVCTRWERVLQSFQPERPQFPLVLLTVPFTVPPEPIVLLSANIPLVTVPYSN